MRWAIGLALGLALTMMTSMASAYPWMIRHGYAGARRAIRIHREAGALTEYGRAQSDLALPHALRRELGLGRGRSTSGLLGGLVPLPESLRVGGDFREAYFSNQVESAPVEQKFITMRADLTRTSRWADSGRPAAIGYVPQGDSGVAHAIAEHNLVSREHWLGVELDEDGAWLVRAGRIALPFGLRMIEHKLWARTLTRTDIDETQQYGLALPSAKTRFACEVMGIAGNFQVRPDDFRERGYSAYAEYAPHDEARRRGSSLFTRATRDIVYGVTDYFMQTGSSRATRRPAPGAPGRVRLRCTSRSR